MTTLNKFKKGFTLIELLVVIAIIGLLSSIVLASLNSARSKAKYARAKIDIEQIKKAMLIYKIDKGELPPPGDNCSACSNPPNSSWTLVINALVNGGYFSGRIDKDPWGSPYLLDENEKEFGASDCRLDTIRSAGPDGVSSGDDIGYIIPHSSTCP